MSAKLIEFQPESVVSLDGYKVPYLTATKLSENEYNLVVDNRFGAIIHTDDLNTIIYLIAHGMAVAAGFTCHGKNSKRANPFNTMMLEIGTISTDEDDSLDANDE